jgi:hypothetical protein
MVQLKVISQADRDGGFRRIGEKPISHAPNNSSRAAPVWSVSGPADARMNAMRGGQAPVAAPMARQPVRPVVAPPVLPRVAVSSGLGLLIAALILVALVPSALLGAMVWHGTINPPSPQTVTQAPAVQTVLPAVLTAPATIEASAGEDLGFPIALDGTDGVPPRSVIAIGGLPPGSSFSEGRPYGEAEWNLRSDQIGDLRLILPDDASGEAKLTIKLIAPDDSVIADAETVLEVTQAASAPVAHEDGGEAALAVAEADAGGEAKQASIEAAMAPSAGAAIAPAAASVKPPSDNNDQTGSIPTETGAANWVQPSAYVNLRDAASSSSRIIGVVAKGVKVEVTDRKRGWLQVTNPATSEKGWIYSGYIEGAPKTSLRTRRAAVAEPEQKSESSFWSSVGHWLSN